METASSSYPARRNASKRADSLCVALRGRINLAICTVALCGDRGR
jgi:hypothetical protein